MIPKSILSFFIITFQIFQSFSQVNVDIKMSDKNWHHLDIIIDSIPGLSTNKAYSEVLKNKKSKKIIVAILDTGVDIEHEDLKVHIWVNIDEIPKNGIDDDKNGYIDDIHGWNFLGNPNGENLEYDTWELTRIYVLLEAEFGSVDTSELDAIDRAQYTKYLEIREKFETEKAKAKQMYDAYKEFKNSFDNSVGLIKNIPEKRK